MTYTFSSLTLRHKEEYFVTVKVSNIVGLSTRVTSNAITVDLTPPEPVKHMSVSSSNLDGLCNTLFDSCNGEISSEWHFLPVFCLPHKKILKKVISYINYIVHVSLI
jgi:hypothetical protein